MYKLPENVTRIDVLRVERDMAKLCQCREPTYTVDTTNRFVYCQTCGAIVDPFDALSKLARHYGRLNDQVTNLLDQAKAIQSYKPHLKIFKRLEQSYVADKYAMVPNCPRCGKAFDYTELVCFTNRKYCGMPRGEDRG